ncbi:MAG: Type IV pilus biogenesis and competence protein PilQ precursor [Planctomycetes bacterium ADurb.Bin401]|nr:MAG: Type IV pilus biogenesis and competence protein PilQ precursor [Planctomycetes bacterium ADurb.Bin401]
MKKQKVNEKKTQVRNILLTIIVLLCTVAAVTGQTSSDSLITEQDLSEQLVTSNLSQDNISAENLIYNEVKDIDKGIIESINFKKDMSIRDALNLMAAKYHTNIICSAKVDGRINVLSLYGITFEEALLAILGNDFKYEIEGNFIKIYTNEEYQLVKLDEARLTSKVFTLYYVNAAEVKALIEPALSTKGKISTTTAAALDTEAGKGGDSFSMRDMVTVYDFPERIAHIEKLIKQIDVRPPQVMIEVTILEATLTETMEFGIEWSRIGDLTPLDISANLANSNATAFTANFSNSQITAAITAEEGISSVTVLANPKIMALNKQAGYLNIGRETGYTKSTTQNETGTTTSVDFLVSGTILKFRPYICDDGYIRMELSPELSSTSLRDANGTSLPDKSITTVKTNIMVKDGKTIIIGGLFQEDLTNNDTQVPVVGDLPIVGWLFKRTSDENVRRELVVLITPHIINEPEDSRAEQRKDDIDRIVHGSRKQISPLSRISIYENGYSKAVKLYNEGKYQEALQILDRIIAFRPSVLEAQQLRSKILSETEPEKNKKSEREMIDAMSQKLDEGWFRR